jgi:PleD family two-component response regulator
MARFMPHLCVVPSQVPRPIAEREPVVTRLVLVVCSDDQRLQARHAVVRRAGYRSLPASSMARALFLLGKVRPDLVLVDAELADGRAPALIRAMRGVAALEQVRVVVLGAVTAEEHRDLARDSLVHVREVADDGAIGALLEEFLGRA